MRKQTRTVPSPRTVQRNTLASSASPHSSQTQAVANCSAVSCATACASGVTKSGRSPGRKAPMSDRYESTGRSPSARQPSITVSAGEERGAVTHSSDGFSWPRARTQVERKSRSSGTPIRPPRRRARRRGSRPSRYTRGGWRRPRALSISAARPSRFPTPTKYTLVVVALVPLPASTDDLDDRFVVEVENPAERIDPGFLGLAGDGRPLLARQGRHERGVDGALVRVLEQRLDLALAAPRR